MIASPYAKKLAREAGVDVSQATASGSEGRIVAADVQKLISEGGGKAKPQQGSAAPGAEQSGQVSPCHALQNQSSANEIITNKQTNKQTRITETEIPLFDN